MSRIPPTRAASLALFLVAAVAPLSAQKDWVDARFGYRIEPPKGYVSVPAEDQRVHALVRFVAPKPLTARAGGTYLPEVWVGFLGGEGEVEKDGLPRLVPARNFDDWVARCAGVGAKVTSREAFEADGLSGRRFVVEIPGDRARTLTGAVFPVTGIDGLGDGEVVVVFDVMTEHLAKERKTVERCVQSLAKADDGEAVPPAPVAPWSSDAAAWQGMAVADRIKARDSWAQQRVDWQLAHPEPDWKESKCGFGVTVLSHAPSGTVKKAVKAAEVAREWCEATLPGLKGEAKPAVLRIFDSPATYATFKARVNDQRDYSRDRRELYFFEDPNAGSSDGYGMLFRAVLWHYVDDADPRALQAMPRWLDNGLWEYLRSTKLKGKKIEFEAGDVERGRLDYQRRNDSMPALWNLIQESIQPSPEHGGNEDVWGYTPECSKLMRWLCEDDGGAAFGKPDFLSGYVRALGEACQVWGADPVNDVDVQACSSAQLAEQRKAYYAWRDGVLKNCNDTYLPLAVEKWQEVNGKWLAYVAEKK